MKKRFLSILLTLTMLLSLFPGMAVTVSAATTYNITPADSGESETPAGETKAIVNLGADSFSVDENGKECTVCEHVLTTVTILWRYAMYKGFDVSVGVETNILSYGDAFDIAHYAIPAMQWACGAGLVTGIADENGGMILDPQGATTRAQIATVLMRFCVEIEK